MQQVRLNELIHVKLEMMLLITAFQDFQIIPIELRGPEIKGQNCKVITALFPTLS